MKRVCIVMPVYNPGKEFTCAVESILNQSYKNIQLLIINDCSRTGLKAIENVMKRRRVTYLQTDRNLGGGAARNLGLRHCDSDYVAFCDSDDVWPADKLEKQITFMETHGHVMSHTDITVVDVANRDKFDIVSSNTINLVEFLRKTNLYCSTVCIKRSVLGDKTFSEMKIRHPFKLWVSILETGVVSHKVPSVKVEYLKRFNSVSSKTFMTIFYTLFSYAYYPDNKLLSVLCLCTRIVNARKANSRIISGLKRK